ARRGIPGERDIKHQTGDSRFRGNGMFIGVCELVFLSRLVEAKPTIGRKTAVVRKAWFWLRQNVMSWSVLKIDLLSVTAVLLACNLLIYTFVNLEEVKQEAAHAQ